MSLFGFGTGAVWESWVISAAVLAIFVGLAFLSKVILGRVVPMFTKRTQTNLDDLITEAIKGPMFAVLILLGLWLSVARVPELSRYVSVVHQIFIVFLIIVVSTGTARVVNMILVWYGEEIATRTKTDIDDKLLPLLRRLSTFLIYIIAIMMILAQLGQEITPLLAGLGIGGLAVALALQPTLSNFLAGTYVMSDAVIHKGHYIKLDSGAEGIVEDIGWRITKIRDWQGNLVILPNAKMADAVVINYEKPDASMLFIVDCGVSYDSDLTMVEQITIAVGQEVMQKFPEGAKDFTTVVRFKEFGDSNINFAVVLKAVNRPGQFIVKHEFIKALHRRFADEGIEIQYPVRKVYFASNLSVEGIPPKQRQ